MFIPIGIDCGNAGFLKDHNLRTASLPFDSVVTYNGVYNIIKTNFKNFIHTTDDIFNSKDSVTFKHHTFPQDTETMLRRIKRFQTILETSTEHITFIRKGHAFHHHAEYKNHIKRTTNEETPTNDIIKSDIQDAEDLDGFLRETYPNLQYTIIVILICGSCFNSEEQYSSSSANIKIYNIATPIGDGIKYTNLCLELFTF